MMLLVTTAFVAPLSKVGTPSVAPVMKLSEAAAKAKWLKSIDADKATFKGGRRSLRAYQVDGVNWLAFSWCHGRRARALVRETKRNSGPSQKECRLGYTARGAATSRSAHFT